MDGLKFWRFAPETNHQETLFFLSSKSKQLNSSWEKFAPQAPGTFSLLININQLSTWSSRSRSSSSAHPLQLSCQCCCCCQFVKLNKSAMTGGRWISNSWLDHFHPLELLDGPNQNRRSSSQGSRVCYRVLRKPCISGPVQVHFILLEFCFNVALLQRKS